ncbi:sugar phosphate permease [Paraburkholderia sp. BL27I4N3]|nr:sugar phosphate permease [Paraburkholderia sp. BL27I4N3]
MPGVGARSPSTSISRYSWISLLMLWLVFAMNANSRQMIYLVLPSVIKEYNIGATTIGFITTLITVSTAFLAVPAMVWVDRGGHGWMRKFRHLPIVVAYTLFTFLTGFNVLTITLWGLVGLQVLSHMFGGIGESIEVTAAAEWWPAERRGLALGIHHTAFPWGTLLGGFAISWLLSTYGAENWRFAFLLFPIPTALIFIGYWRFCSQKRYDTFLKHLKTTGETSPIAGDAHSHVDVAPGAIRRAMANPNISVIALVSMMAIVGYFGLSFWLPQYLAFVAHYNFAEAAAYSVVFTITGGLGQIAWGWISDRVGRKICLIILFVWLTFAFYLFQFASLSLGWLIGVQLFAGLALNAPYTLLYAMAFDSAEKNATGVAISIINTGCYAGGIGPLIIGALITFGGGYSNHIGYDYALYFVMGLMAFSALLIALFTRETTGWFRKHDRAIVAHETCNLNY